MDANTSYLLEEDRRQEKAEQRQEMIEAMANDLVQEGAEYFPWKLEHVLEAVENAPESMQMTMVASLAAAIVDSKLKNDVGNHLALVAVKKLVEDYWLEAAKKQAEREID